MNFQDDIQQIIMLKAILKTGVIVGTLDALTAIIILAKMNAVGVFQFIASGAFGKEAFSGGAAMTTTGILFHYLFAFFLQHSTFFVSVCNISAKAKTG